MRQLGYKLLFLLGAVIFSILCLCLRNRGGAAWSLLALDLATAGGGAALGLYSLHPSDWLQVLKLVPLALIAAGGVINIAHRIALRRSKARRRHETHH